MTDLLQRETAARCRSHKTSSKMIDDCDRNQPDIADPPCLRLSRHQQRVQSQLLYRKLVNMNSTSTWQHDHIFGQDQVMPGERRTIIVIVITATMMTVEIGAGVSYGSMALLADGLHMASHATALAVAALAYVYARRHAHDERFSFGTGKVNALGGFTGAILLAVFAAMMVWESANRFFDPVHIDFNQAIFVAVLGLIVNGVSAVILGVHENNPSHEHHHAHEDHNLRSAYLHVVADALTSVLAIGALLAGKFYGQVWLDPAMGVVGCVLVARWSWSLMRATSLVLLDRQASERILTRIREAIEGDDRARVIDLHVWSIGPGKYAAIISVLTETNAPADSFKSLIPTDLGIVHVTVEVNQASITPERCVAGRALRLC